MKVFFRITDHLARGAFVVAVAALAGVFVLDCFRIVSRYFFGMPQNWVPGMLALLTNWAVFLGVGWYLYVRETIVIDYFYEKWLSPSWRRRVDVLTSLVVVAFAVLAIHYGWNVYLRGDHQSSLSTLPLAYKWYTLPFVLGMLLGLIGTLKFLVLQPEREGAA